MFYVAFKMLVENRMKYLSIILGIAFSSFIMTQQPAIFLGLLSRTYSFIKDNNMPDIWVMDPTVKYVDDYKPLLFTDLYRVASVEGVKWAKPLYKGNIQARLSDGSFQNCSLIGIDDATLVGGPPEMIEGKLEDLRRSNSIIVSLEDSKDKLANPSKMPGGKKEPLKIGDTIELNDKYAVVVGIAKTTRTFQSQPIIYTRLTQAISFIPPQRNILNFVLVKAKDGQDLTHLAEKITNKTQLAAYTREGFIKRTVSYYLYNTGIPINFGISVLLGFLIGVAIAGQSFFNFTLENLKYFAVLKAMGASQKTLFLMILLQALIVGEIGYGLGIGGTCLFALTTQNSLLAFKFPWQLLMFSTTGILLISFLSAAFSIRKVLNLEAAIVFKG